jgi:hypothetical protein
MAGAQTLFGNILVQLESMGLTDLLIPLILIFAVIFSILNVTKLFKRQISIVVALVISLLTVIPHINKTYPACYDIVTIINQATPKISLLVIAIVMFFLVVGLFGMKLDSLDKILPYIAIGALLVTVFVFFTSSSSGCGVGNILPFNIWSLPGWIYVIPLTVMVVVIWFIVRGKGTAGPGKPAAPKAP